MPPSQRLTAEEIRAIRDRHPGNADVRQLLAELDWMERGLHDTEEACAALSRENAKLLAEREQMRRDMATALAEFRAGDTRLDKLEADGERLQRRIDAALTRIDD